MGVELANLPTERIASERHTRELSWELNLQIGRLRESLAKVIRVSVFAMSAEVLATQSKLKLGAKAMTSIYRCKPSKRSKSAGDGGAGGSGGTGGGGPSAWTLVGEESQLGNPNWACPKHKVCAGHILAKYVGTSVLSLST